MIVMYGIVLAGFLAGCTIPTREDVARSTTEFNLVAEKAGNEMLLLNIIRASKRRPMYFTSIGKLTRSMNFKYGTGDISIPFGRIGGGLDGSYSIAPSASYEDGPLLDVSVLDTKEFTNGIMMPVPMTTIGYYRSQGWNKEMLLHLFIRRIEIIDKNDPNIILDKWDNYPGERKKFERFQDKIRKEKWDIVVDRSTKATKIGELDPNEVLKMENLIEMHKAGLKLKNNKELHLGHEEYVFSYVNPEKEIETIRPCALNGTRVYTRSPEAILYYLGEILRAEIKTGDPNLVMIRAGIGEKCKSVENRLFYARNKRDGDKNPCVSVNYEKTAYVIPETHDTDKGCCTDRSMHVLSLVSQLIGLQKKSELVPTTGMVRVIGR
jgi:hypothetical protein